MWKRVFNRLREVPAVLWLAGAIFFTLSFWFDYYHPGGFVFDGAILAGLLVELFKPETKDDPK